MHVASPSPQTAATTRPNLVGLEAYLWIIAGSVLVGPIFWTLWSPNEPLFYIPFVGATLATALLIGQALARSKAEASFVPPPPRAVRFYGVLGGERWSFTDRFESFQLEGPRIGDPTHTPPTPLPGRALPPLDSILDGVICGASFQAAVAAASPVFTTLSRLSADFGYAVSLDPESVGHVSPEAREGFLNFIEGHVGETLAAETLSRTWARRSVRRVG